jgi:Ca2+-binding RTX toxin-like protein
MTNVTAFGNFQYDLSHLDAHALRLGHAIAHSATSFSFALADGHTIDTFSGTGLNFDASGFPTGGSINGYVRSIGEHKAFSLTANKSIPALAITFISATAATSDDQAVYARLLAGNDVLKGGDAGDVINGFGDSDRIYGGKGNDVLTGGGGYDFITGGLGRDILTGGSGGNLYEYNSASESTSAPAGRDIITDFSHLLDRIDLSAIDANALALGHQAFTFKGTAAFSGHAGELHYRFETTSRTIIEADVNGDKVADFAIELTGHKAVGAVDFIL